MTGASGYIGGRLVPELLARGYKIRVYGQSPFPELIGTHGQDVENCHGADALELDHLKIALKGIDTAYYLIHSLLLAQKQFAAADIQAAINFRIAAEQDD